MLTPTDVHILTGILTVASSPDDVEIELGSYVYDAKAEKPRDVDITVTYKKPDGTSASLHGIEVKDHSRPLDVAQVEQLAAKLEDMPALSYKAIVSASAYSDPARKKALAREIHLFTLTEWREPIGFDHVQFAPNMRIGEMTLECSPGSHIELDFEPGHQMDPTTDFSEDLPIVDSSGHPIEGCEDCVQLKERIVQQFRQQWLNENTVTLADAGRSFRIERYSEFGDEAYIRSRDEPVRLVGAAVTVEFRVVIQQHPGQYKALVDDVTGQPIVGCFVAEFSGGNLFGFTASSTDKKLRMINISVSSRNLEKIKQMELRQRS